MKITRAQRIVELFYRTQARLQCETQLHLQGFFPACRRFLVLNHCAFSCRRIFLKNLRLACRIGAYETERSAPQSVVFNADIWVRFSASSSQRDALEDVLNYDLAVEIFREESSRGHIDLQETLVDRIAERLSNLPGVELIRISS